MDHVERIADTDLLSVLLKAKEITGRMLYLLTHVSVLLRVSGHDLAGANIGLILISNVAWGSCLFDCDTLRVVRPAQLVFPSYEEDVITKVRLSNIAPRIRIFAATTWILLPIQIVSTNARIMYGNGKGL